MKAALEIFYDAVRTLIVSTDLSLQERLNRAWGYQLAHLRTEGIADDVLRERVAAFTREAKERIDSEPSRVATEIFEIFIAIVRHDASRPGPSGPRS